MSSALTPLHTAEAVGPARGVVYLHACPRALSPHVEWALSQVLGVDVSLDWTPQPVVGGSVRAELSWQCVPGTGALIASALTGFSHLRFEVTEEPTPGREGERFAATPALGMFRATIGMHGDIMIPEDRLRAVMGDTGSEIPLPERIGELLGAQWDEELEPFRYAGEGNSVRWLHEVG